MVAKCHFMLVPVLFFASADPAAASDPCDGGACCVNPATCVVTDLQTLAGLTVDSIVPCDITLGIGPSTTDQRPACSRMANTLTNFP